MRVPVQVATSTPIYGYLRVLKAPHYYRMWLHNLVHHQAAIHQLRLLMEQLPKGTDAHLDHSFQAVLQGLLQEAKRSDGSRSDVQEVIHQCLERCSGLEFRGSLAYDPQSSKSAADAAFVARAEQGGGGEGRDSGALPRVCYKWKHTGECSRGDKCQFEHAQRGQPGGSKLDPKTILCSHFQLNRSCKDGDRCRFKHSQPAQPATNLPPETGPKGGSDRGRTEERVGKTAPRTARGSPWRDKCAAGLKYEGIDDGACALWHHPAQRSPSATPSPSRDSASSDSVSEMVRKAGFNKHFKGYVHVVPPPEQANLATAKEAGPQRSVRFRDVPDEICLVPESHSGACSLLGCVRDSSVFVHAQRSIGQVSVSS